MNEKPAARPMALSDVAPNGVTPSKLLDKPAAPKRPPRRTTAKAAVAKTEAPKPAESKAAGRRRIAAMAQAVIEGKPQEVEDKKEAGKKALEKIMNREAEAPAPKAKRGRKAKEKATAAMPEGFREESMYKLASTPRGHAQFTYTCAILQTLGGFTEARAEMAAESLTRFYRGPKIVEWHTGNGNFETVRDGILRLSRAGLEYFTGRLTGSTVGQQVDVPEVNALAAAFRTGELEASTRRFMPATCVLAPIKVWIK